MTKQPKSRHKNPSRPFRPDPAEWEALGLLVGPRDRTRVLRELLRWYIREPGAKLPTRPTAEKAAEARAQAATRG